ncbi:hypothetical protein NQ318_000240 [Aromia moschata]|uniref:DUF4817 domain-containing protein n=1 Tax=Aromia moschata TaxID=1265417 RepID=A0AAV8XAK6_9CUCU|nr:hypothetical protein NQ318_000240 [Aromia moschata]
MLTLEQRIYLIQCYGTGEECYRVVIKKFNGKYPEVSISNVGAKKLVTKFLETGTVLYIKKSKKLLNEDDAASVLALHSVREAPRLSLRRRSIETEISKSHLQRIFKQNRILPFKPKFRHTLEEGDEAKRLDFCLEMGNRVLNDVGFHKRILFSDESTFSTNGVVSSQHCRYWNGCPAHQAFTVCNWLNSEFNEHWIGRDGPILWPPRSPDLTILDFHLWGRLKQMVYREPLENDEEQLKTRIQNAVKSLSIEEIRNSFNEFRARIEICAEKGGALFK